MDVPKRRRTTESSAADDIDGLSERLQSVSLCISAAMDFGRGNKVHDADDLPQHRERMDELRLWYQTEVFAGTDVQQHRWEERRWAFLGQLQHALRKPLNHTAFVYDIALVNGNTPNQPRSTTLDVGDINSAAFGGLLFVGRSRYNDIVIADETVSRVHCIIVRSAGTVGVFDGWSSYGTVTVERGRADQRCEESAVENRRPLLFDEGESFTLRVGKHATIRFSG
jgi:hypothetical protein